MHPLLNALLLCLLLSVGAVQAQDQQTDCDKYPGSLGCAAVDVPTPTPIPSQSKNITLETGPTFGGGGCPANVTMGLRGHQITLLPISTACGWLVDYVRPIMLLLAAITALFIVMPGSED